MDLWGSFSYLSWKHGEAFIFLMFFKAGVPHEVSAGPEGLYLFVRFMPAIC